MAFRYSPYAMPLFLTAAMAFGLEPGCAPLYLSLETTTELLEVVLDFRLVPHGHGAMHVMRVEHMFREAIQ